jgi:PST family polysaccharide transporter
LVQHKDPTEDHFHAAWTLQFLRNLILAIIFALSAIPAAAIFQESRLIGLMAVLSLSVLLQGIINPRSIMMTRDLVFWQQFMLQVGSRVVGVIVSIVIALLYQSYWALVWGTVAAQITNVLLSYTVLPFMPRPRLRGARDLLNFSVWLTLGQVINTINWRSDHLFVGGYLGRVALGHYTVGDNLAIMPTREVTLPLTQTLFPAFSRLADDPGRLRLVYQRAQALVTAVALPAGVGTALVAYPLVLLVMGAKWLPAVAVIQCLASVFAFQTLGSLSQPLAMATNNTKLLFRRDLQGFLIRMPTIVIGMLAAGLTGVLYARILTGSLAIILHMNVVRRITGLSFMEQMRVNLRAIGAVATMAIALIGLGFVQTNWGYGTEALALRLATMILLGTVVYAGTSLLLWKKMGSPEGPETELLMMIGKATSKIRARS